MSTSEPTYDHPPPGLDTTRLIERIDSDRTDDSPFGSALTTPVDEDVILFPGIEQRLVGKPLKPHQVPYLVFQADSTEGGIVEHAFSKVVDQGGTKLVIENSFDTAPTPSPSLEQVPINVSNSELPNALVSRPRASSIYSHPNLPLDITDVTENAVNEEVVSPLISKVPIALTPPIDAVNISKPFDTIAACEPFDTEHTSKLLESRSTEDTTSSAKPNLSHSKYHSREAAAQIAKDLLSLLPFSHQSASLDDLARANDCFSSLQECSFRTLAPLALLVVLFLPWCVIAGASILLFPTHLETIVFRPGYVTSPKGIHRYAFWTEVSKELVSIFLAFLVVVWYLVPKIAVLLACASAAQFIYAWQDFEVNRSIPLGEDDRQSLYYMWRHCTSGDAFIGLSEDEDGFYSLAEGRNEKGSQDEDEMD